MSEQLLQAALNISPFMSEDKSFESFLREVKEIEFTGRHQDLLSQTQTFRNYMDTIEEKPYSHELFTVYHFLSSFLFALVMKEKAHDCENTNIYEYFGFTKKAFDEDYNEFVTFVRNSNPVIHALSKAAGFNPDKGEFVIADNSDFRFKF